MLNLFKIEWMKVRSYRAFWVLFGAFVILFPLSFYYSASKYMEHADSRPEQVLKAMLGNPFQYPGAWLSSSWFGGIFFVMIGMLFILLVTNEVQYRTHRQNIIDGWSRLDFLLAKFTMLLFFVVVSTLIVFLCGLWIGSLYSPTGTSVTKGIYYLGYFALMATMYLVVAYVIAILVKRTGLSIIIYFAFVCLIDNLLWLVLTRNGSQGGYFLPVESTDSLVPNPFKPKALEKRTLTDMTLIITASGYIIVFCYFIKQYFQRIDLKT